MESGDRQAFLIGGGIGSLAAAVYLIRDGRMSGQNIVVFDEGEFWGGSLDASGSANAGYAMRGGRMFEEHFVCTYDLLSEIPSYDDPHKSARDDIFDFHQEASWYSRSRLIDKNGAKVNVSTMGFNMRDRFDLTRLLLTPEALLNDKRIDDYFGSHFFTTNFWYMWCSMFAFEPWHSAIEMRRYLLRFMHQFPKIADMTGIYHTRYSQYHSIVVPIQRWLKSHGVRFRNRTEVLDLELTHDAGQVRVCEIALRHEGVDEQCRVRSDDLVIVTNGSMTAASAMGSMSASASLNRAEPGRSWALWKRLASEYPELGRPDKFVGNVDQSKWLSFTVTTKSPLFKEFMEKYTGNTLGRGGLITFRDSNWLMTINVHHNPVYPGQPEDTYLWWGYGLFPDRVGNFISKKMADCTGEDLLRESLAHLKLSTQDTQKIVEASQCIPCMMPYITSQFMPRSKGDRPAVVPKGSVNLAFVGQFCELPDDTVFTVEYSVRAAKMAVTTLLKLNKPIPPVYVGGRDVHVLLDTLRASIGFSRVDA